MHIFHWRCEDNGSGCLSVAGRMKTTLAIYSSSPTSVVAATCNISQTPSSASIKDMYSEMSTLQGADSGNFEQELNNCDSVFGTDDCSFIGEQDRGEPRWAAG